MSYFENQANEARRDLSSIEMNGGIGSSAYYDAQNRYNEARRNQAWHDPKPSNPFGTWSAPNTLPSGGAGAPFLTGTPARSGPRRRHTPSSFGVLLLSFLVAVCVFVLVFTSVPPMPTDLHVMPVDRPGAAGRPASAELVQMARQRTVEGFRQAYGHLYAPTAPWDDLLPKCEANPKSWACARLDMSRVTGFGAHLLEPKRFPQDFCAASWRDAQRRAAEVFGIPFQVLGHGLLPLLRLPEPRWSLTPAKPGLKGLGSHVCSPVNRWSLAIATRDLREKVQVAAVGGFLLVMVPGWWFARRMRRLA